MRTRAHSQWDGASAVVTRVQRAVWDENGAGMVDRAGWLGRRPHCGPKCEPGLGSQGISAMGEGA